MENVSAIQNNPNRSVAYPLPQRARLCLGERGPGVLDVPPLNQIQISSYERFKEVGLESAFSSVFPIVSYSGIMQLEYVGYTLGKPIFNIAECKVRGTTYAAPLKVKLRLVFFDKDVKQGNAKVVEMKEQEVFMGELPLMTPTGSVVINGTERVIVSQLHRSPGVCFEHDKGKTHSSGKLLFSARIIPYRGSWLDFEFDPKDNVFARIDRRRKMPATIILRALGYTTVDILKMFYENDHINLTENDALIDLVPSRLRGELAMLDISDDDGNIIVEQGRRISGRHIRLMEKANLKQLIVPHLFLFGKAFAEDIIDTETGEVLFMANTEITEEVVARLLEKGIKSFQTLYINEIECGPYISKTLRLDNSSNELEALVEIYRILRPGEPPTKDAAEALFHSLFLIPIVMIYLKWGA